MKIMFCPLHLVLVVKNEKQKESERNREVFLSGGGYTKSFYHTWYVSYKSSYLMHNFHKHFYCINKHVYWEYNVQRELFLGVGLEQFVIALHKCVHCII